MGRIIRVRLSVVPVNDTFRILTELDSPDIEDEFNERDGDRDQFRELQAHQQRARQNRQDHQNRRIDQREYISAADYDREPDYAHAGIHIQARQQDEIAWFSNQRINFIIEVGPDPQLFRLQDDLLPNQPLITKAQLHQEALNPFVNPGRFPLFCVSGREVSSGPMVLDGAALHPTIRDQRYYKFSVTVLGTGITLDPHIEGHDE